MLFGNKRRYQLCEITNGIVYRYYAARHSMSKNKATTLTKEECHRIMLDIPHHNMFIVSERDCLFRHNR